jgi:hypothetical protein
VAKVMILSGLVFGPHLAGQGTLDDIITVARGLARHP